MKNENNSDIRPCIYKDKDGEHSVGLHCFNGNMAIIEFPNGSVKEVSINDIELLDSIIELNSITCFSTPECIKRYWENAECFEKNYNYLKESNPDLFKEK